MAGLVRPLEYDTFAPQWNAWQQNHSKVHDSLDANVATLLATSGNTRSSGTYQPQFNSGPVQFAGPNGSFLGSDNLIFGTKIPNPAHDFPSGGGVSLLIGTGGAENPNRDAWIITDQAFDPTLDGNTLGITAGETQGSGTANGGLLWLLGGAAFGGTGGELRLQAGTSRNGPGGFTQVLGGNSTGGPAGDLFLSGGQAGTIGANVHLIMTVLNGVAGVIRIRANSSILYEIQSTGAIFIGATGAGLAGSPLISGGPAGSPQWANTYFTGTVTIARITPGGSEGLLTFLCGLCTAVTQPA